jgi:hypothetical protein
LTIEKSGDPSGANSRILIRGVVHLVIMTHCMLSMEFLVRPEVFASLSPSAIASIQVLKMLRLHLFMDLEPKWGNHCYN